MLFEPVFPRFGIGGMQLGKPGLSRKLTVLNMWYPQGFLLVRRKAQQAVEGDGVEAAGVGAWRSSATRWSPPWRGSRADNLAQLPSAQLPSALDRDPVARQQSGASSVCYKHAGGAAGNYSYSATSLSQYKQAPRLNTAARHPNGIHCRWPATPLARGHSSITRYRRPNGH